MNEKNQPVAIKITGKLGDIYSFHSDYSLKKGDYIYTAPPQREWVGLTDEEIEKLFVWQEWSEDFAEYEPVARAIEAKLKEKNT